MIHFLRFSFLLSVALAFSPYVSADVVQEWLFDDASGTTFGNAGSTWVNSGSVGDARFGGSGAASTDHETDGNGLLCVTGDNNLNRYVTTNSTMTSISSGLVQLSFRYDSMDLSASAAEHINQGATGNIHLFGNIGFGFTSGGSVIEQFRLQLIQNTSGGINDPVLAFQHRDVAGNDVDNLLNTGSATLSGPFDVRVTVDLDNGGAMQIFANDGSGEIQLFDLETGGGQTYGAASIDGIQFQNQQNSTNQGDQMLGTDNGKIDFVRLEIIEAIPEPNSIALISLLGFGFLTFRDKRR